METILHGFAALLGQIIGRSLSPETWIAIAITTALGNSKFRFGASSILCALALSILWLAYVAPTLRNVGIGIDLNTAEFVRQWLLNAITIALWSLVGRGIVRLIRRFSDSTTTSTLLSVALILTLIGLLHFGTEQVLARDDRIRAELLANQRARGNLSGILGPRPSTFSRDLYVRARTNAKISALNSVVGLTSITSNTTIFRSGLLGPPDTDRDRIIRAKALLLTGEVIRPWNSPPSQ